MAEKSGERRMLFDTRGRRRNVIRVVYATLALLMGASLFVAVGPFNLAEILGTSSGGGGEAAEIFEEEAEKVEQRLAKNPTDEALLLRLTRARISAGNAMIEVTPGGEPQEPPLEAKREFNKALEAWNSYLAEAGDEPSPTAAQLVAGTLFRLAETQASVREARENVASATEAQLIAAEQQPSIGSLSTLAYYQYFNGEFGVGEATKRKAEAKASSKAEAKAIDSQLAGLRKNAKQFEQRTKQLEKLEKRAQRQGAQGLNPFGQEGTAPPGE